MVNSRVKTGRMIAVVVVVVEWGIWEAILWWWVVWWWVVWWC